MKRHFRFIAFVPGLIFFFTAFHCAENVSDAKKSKTKGARIYFTATEGGPFEIWSVKENGGGLQRVTENDVQERFPAVSPDRSRLAYCVWKPHPNEPCAEENPLGDLHILNLGSGEEVRITDPLRSKAYKGPILWSKDGKQLVLEVLIGHVCEEGQRMQGQFHAVYTLDADGANARRVIGNAPNRYGKPSFSPDGAHVASSGDGAIFVDRKVILKNVVKDERGISQRIVSTAPVWSPAGDKILFLSRNRNETAYRMHGMNPDGSGMKVLAPFTYGHGGNPGCWSPDGGKIAFKAPEGEEQAIHVLDMESGETTAIFTSGALTPPSHALYWSPDGKRLAFELLEEGGKTICTIGADGKKMKRVVEGLPVEEIVSYR